MRPRLFVVLAALRVVVAGSAVGAMPTHHPAAGPAVPNDWSALERATIIPGSKPGELTLELPAVDLPAGTLVDAPASVGEFPVDGSIYALHAELGMQGVNRSIHGKLSDGRRRIHEGPRRQIHRRQLERQLARLRTRDDRGALQRAPIVRHRRSGGGVMGGHRADC